jgi:hypothetical protein
MHEGKQGLDSAPFPLSCHLGPERKEAMDHEETIDLSGSWFGRLRVLRSAPAHHICGCRRWRCQCECGDVVDAYESALLSGVTVSCGCQNQAKPKRVTMANAA